MRLYTSVTPITEMELSCPRPLFSELPEVTSTINELASIHCNMITIIQNHYFPNLLFQKYSPQCSFKPSHSDCYSNSLTIYIYTLSILNCELIL